MFGFQAGRWFCFSPYTQTNMAHCPLCCWLHPKTANIVSTRTWYCKPDLQGQLAPGWMPTRCAGCCRALLLVPKPTALPLLLLLVLLLLGLAASSGCCGGSGMSPSSNSWNCSCCRRRTRAVLLTAAVSDAAAAAAPCGLLCLLCLLQLGMRYPKLMQARFEGVCWVSCRIVAGKSSSVQGCWCVPFLGSLVPGLCMYEVKCYEMLYSGLLLVSLQDDRLADRPITTSCAARQRRTQQETNNIILCLFSQPLSAAYTAAAKTTAAAMVSTRRHPEGLEAEEKMPLGSKAASSSRKSATPSGRKAATHQPAGRKRKPAAEATPAPAPAPATAPAPAPTADLLPAELLQQLQQARQQQQQQQKHKGRGQPDAQTQQTKRHRQPSRKKQRIVEVQKGPVRVAVLPALSGPAAAAGGSWQQQQQQSAGALLRQQLLESRLHRSKIML